MNFSEKSPLNEDNSMTEFEIVLEVYEQLKTKLFRKNQTVTDTQKNRKNGLLSAITQRVTAWE